MLRTVLTCCLLTLWTAPAMAQDPPAEPDRTRAMELYANGAALYEEGLYEEAIVAFNASYALTQEPDLLYNIASAQERLGHWREALNTLNRYRAFARADEREPLDRRIRNLERRLAAQEAQAVPAPVTSDEALAATIPRGAQRPERVRRRPTAVHGILLAGGGALLVGGVATSVVTFQQSRSWKQDGDSERWNRWRPLNNVGVVSAIAGGGLITTALVLPGKPIEVAVRADGLALRGRF